MSDDIPSITGKQLLKLLKKDGWKAKRRTKHGVGIWKLIDGRKRVSTIPTKNSDLPASTLGQILGPKQTGIGREGLADLIEKYGT